jgi:protein-disulfide isomerase
MNMSMTSVESGVLTPPVGSQDHRRGPDNAEVTLVEYGDYECRYCRQAHMVVNALIRDIGDKLLFVFRHFPLGQIHPYAQRAAEAAEAAAAQGAFWQMHDRLYENQALLTDIFVFELAHELGLDVDRFARELGEGKYTNKVREHMLSGIWSGVNGTPTFFINGRRHDDPWDLPHLSRAITSAMAA